MAVPMRYYIVQLFIYVILFNEHGLSSLKPCSLSNFEKIVLPCSIFERKRKSVYYMNEECDLKHIDSVFPLNQITYLPCDCDAGYGLINDNDTNITCVKCKPGQFSSGGEILSDFKNWNDSSGVPGLVYRAYSYCSDFLSGKQCKSWSVGGGGEYLVSGEVKNSTELRCFEQSILVLSRQFLGSPGNNRVSFLYRVDGKECERDSSSTCSNGLFFYVNGEQKMNSESQFQWKEFSVEVNPGAVRLKFVYQRSCTRTNILDVAFIKQISMVGTVSTESKCLECPAGSFSSSAGSKECVKCSQNDYQDKTGQTKCIPCPNGEFSGIGAISCMKLPNCTQREFYLLPDSIPKCTKDSNGAWFRNQTVLIPNWSNISATVCNEVKDAGDQYKRPDNPKIECFCQPGYFLNTSGPTPKCSMCSVGTYSNGSQYECLSCKPGYAALPGFYMDHFPEGPLPKIMRQSCSGQYCKDGETFWEPRGNYIATRRLPGTFETTLEVNDVFIDYFNASLKFNCSLDCRLNSDDSKLAKLSDCFLRLVVLKDGKTFIEEDCVNKYSSNLRNGTIMGHQYSLSDPGKYSFKVFFHHEDEGNFSLLSFEARIYFIDLLGAVHGSSKQCVECPAGMILSKDRSTCTKCPSGTYSGRGASTCIPCQNGTFASEEGSESCVKCGDGTTSNERRDDCEYNGCKFSPEQGLNFDLSPLSVDGGPMYEVKIYRPFINFYFPPQMFYINLCSKNHDNTSCVTSTRKVDPADRTTYVVKQVFLKTMACKRYYFDRFNSISIGEVLSFKALEGYKKRDGLKVILSGGTKCWNKMTRAYTSPQTSILMMCDLEAGVNRPEQLNFTATDDRLCTNEFLWKTTFACPICTPDDYSEVFSECKNGTQYKTKTRKTKCRLSVGESDIVFKSFPCIQNPNISLKVSKDTTLVITILIAIVLIIALIIILIYNVRRNRYLRSNLFAPGQTFSKIQREDEDELVDNMQS